MKKFVFLYYGAWDFGDAGMRKAWGEWFASIGSHVIDSGSPFAPGLEIRRSGCRQLPQDAEALVGYTIVKAESLEDAQRLAESCPIVSSIRVYEAMAM